MRGVSLACAFSALVACDRGVPIPAVSSSLPVRLLGVSVGPGRPLYDGDAILIAFDRYLDPRTATRQSFAVVDAFGTLTANPLVIYDPETRTVTLQNAEAAGEWLLPDQPYRLIVGIPADGQFLGGVRALDGATLSHAQDDQRIVSFFARSRPAEERPAPETPVSFCEEIQPLFAKSCTRCHDGSVSGLDLRDAAGIRATALFAPAHAGVHGALPTASPPGAVLGDGAAILDPPSAGTSYLLDTILAREIGAKPSRAFCTGTPRIMPALPVPVLDDPGHDERERLSGLLGGGPMPPPDAAEPPLSLDERRLVSRWIREGAAVQTCTAACR